MRKISVFVFLMLMMLSLFSNSLKGAYYSEDGSVTFQEDSLDFLLRDYSNNSIQKKHCNYTFSKDEYGNEIIILAKENKKLRYFTFDDFLLLYENNTPLFFGNSKSSRELENFLAPRITSSSTLVEKDKTYSSEKLAYWGNLNYIWAEGNPENGIGEKLVIEKSLFSKLYFLPGYISVERPDLYSKNSRPKKIRITSGEKSYIFDLLDVPLFQKFSFPEQIESAIEIEILDVYEGTKYKDMCISSILCYK